MKKPFSAFTLIIIFLVLVIIGLGVIPFISIRLIPSRGLNSLTVSYYWPNVSSQIIEREVTSKLEGLFTSVSGVQEITSRSAKGYGRITIDFDKNTDVDYFRFEIASLIRQIFPKLPVGVTRPVISRRRVDESKTAILSYTLTGKASSFYIQKFANSYITPRLSLIDGIYSIECYGATPYEWELIYDKNQLLNLNITTSDIVTALRNYLQQSELGNGFDRAVRSDNQLQSIFLVLQGHQGDSITWSQIPVKKSGNRVFFLTDLVKVRYREQLAKSYYRINGLNTVNIVINAEQGVNHISLADRIKKEIKKIVKEFPEGYSIIKSYDSTEFLKKELKKVAYRTILSMVILLMFVFVISRKWRYLLIVTISLFANLSIAFLFYYLFKLEIHLYSLAGITVSFGIIIDNTIIMVEHIRHKKNIKIILAILAASLTTIGALSVIFFLGEEQRLNLIDFASVMIINLSVSLAIALFFLPSLMEKLPIKEKNFQKIIPRKRRVLTINRLYSGLISYFVRFRVVMIILVILGFGLPVFWLPDKIENERWYSKLYNKTLGHDNYLTNLKPVFNKILGGSLRLFAENVYNRSFYAQPQRTALQVRINMPDGSTVQQMNDLCVVVENFLAKFDEIELFRTEVYSSDNASIEILFKKDYNEGYFPFYLKSQMEEVAISTGGADFGIYGVGRGFSNALYEGYFSSAIILTGYNYNALSGHAEWTMENILEHPRIQEAHITSESGWAFQRRRYLYNLDIDKENLKLSNGSLNSLFGNLYQISVNETPLFSAYINREYTPVVLKANQVSDFELWDLENYPLYNQNSYIKLKNLASIRKEVTDDIIYKENQQYIINVSYNFIGPNELGRRVEERTVNELNSILPLGYKAEGRTYSYRQKAGEQYWLLFLVIGVIYFICAILLESLTQPLAIICMIPISFIGVFLTFYLFNLNFDQGGFASFLLLAGLVVNSGLYILNDYNILKRSGIHISNRRMYLKAFNSKIIPIFLTVFSTVLGLVPFILGGQNEVFWFALAAGTIGGLIFSIPALLIYLPVFMKGMRLDNEMEKGKSRMGFNYE